VRRFKFLGSALLTVVTLCTLLALNLIKSESAREAKDIGIEVTSKKAGPSKKQIKQYNERRQKLRTALESYFKKAIKAGDIVGAGVSIIHKDSILISQGFGKRSFNGAKDVDGETVFRLGSLSKGFAGILAASLVEEGKFDFDDKVVDYIPGFRFGDVTNTQKVRLSHILSHTSGTPYHSFTNLVEAGIPVKTIATRFDEVTPISEPGQLYSYQNAMFSLSQEVMRKVTGTNVKTLLNRRFFEPLGMSTISMDHTTLLETKNVALPHSRRQKGWRSLPLRDRYYNAVVAGGINASSLDMAKWMRFLLGRNPEVLKPATIAKALDPFVEIGYNNKYYQRWPGHKQSYYAFGWRIHTYQESENAEEKTMWHHGGSVNNYRNEIALFPDADVGICVLLNGNSRLAQRVIPDLYRLVEDNYGSSL
jgi:beta-lactamase class C